ncbi:MAG: sulfite exporter TauE/SafE family protein [Pyrinomonadaceae bacterium]
MSLTDIAILAALFFLTSIVGVVTGSNSLITVPLMFQFGIEEKTAVATNMFGLTFMAIGGTIPFLRQGKIEAGKLKPVIVLTLIGSACGAILVGYITGASIKLIVSIGMIAVVVFTLLRREQVEPRKMPLIGYSAAFLLAIYGGLYSGGYVTILTAAFVAFLGMDYAESVGSTKFVNVFSSSIATLVFIWQGLVDYKLGAILAVAMFAGAYVGAHYAAKMNEEWLKRIFLGTVVILAVKTLYDFL